MSFNNSFNPSCNVKTEPGLVSADAEYETFPLKALTQEELEETRYHVLKFHSVKKIDRKSVV